MNWAVVPHATSVAACALLGERRRGLFRAELALRMQQLVDLLRIMDVRLTPALLRDEGDFSDSIASLLRMDLIRAAPDARGEILLLRAEQAPRARHLPQRILHYLAAPSFLRARAAARRHARGACASDLDDLARRSSTASSSRARGPALAAQVDAFLAHFEALGWIERRDGRAAAPPSTARRTSRSSPS